jgi:hypothetical protein
MPYRVKKIKDPSKKKPISLDVGDLVEFATKNSQEGYTELSIKEGSKKTCIIEKVVKAGSRNMSPPTMVVEEIVLENHQKDAFFDVETGKQIGAKIKVKCVWFSVEKCEFHDRWFNYGVLKRVDPKTYNDMKSKINADLDEIVALKTYLLSFKSEDHIISGNWVDEKKQQQRWTLKQSFDLRSFMPPKMVVAELVKADLTNNKPLFDKKKGLRVREAGESFVKCMWYNPQKGGFSEHVFPVECLIPGNQLPDQNTIINQFLQNP